MAPMSVRCASILFAALLTHAQSDWRRYEAVRLQVEAAKGFSDLPDQPLARNSLGFRATQSNLITGQKLAMYRLAGRYM